MASLLDYGAGASEGLDKMLARLLLEQRQAEVERSNKADEGLRGRSIDESAASRVLAQKSLDQSRQDAEASRRRDDVRGIMAMRPANTEVSPETYKYETDNGAPSDFFLKRATGANQEDVKAGVPESLARNNEEPNQIVFRGVRTPQGTETSNQEHQYKLTDVALATSLGKKVGDVIDGNYDPKTTKISYRGQDVTSGVDHYEKPPAPDRVLIQSGEGYVPRADATKTIQAGGTVPLATTSSTRTMQEGATMLEPHVKDVAAQATELDKRGLFGPVMSRVRNGLAKAGSIDEFLGTLEDEVKSDSALSNDRAVGQFITSLGLLASGAGRVHGGARGGGSSQMLAYFKNMLSDASSLQMFLGRIEGVDKYMEGYAAGPSGTKPQESGGVPKVGDTFQGGKVTKITPIK